MAKRLLLGRSSSEENEKLFVSRLKAECGNQYTAKVEGMLTDMGISKTTMNAYKQSEAFAQSEVELDATLLTNGHWPSQPLSPCLLPPSLQECMDSFNAFYTSLNNGRKLTWHQHMGSVDVRANFKKGTRDLNVSTYQACILQLFNAKPTLSLSEIRDGTSIAEVELRRHLLSLCTPKLRIIIKSSKEKVDRFSFLIYSNAFLTFF